MMLTCIFFIQREVENMCSSLCSAFTLGRDYREQVLSRVKEAMDDKWRTGKVGRLLVGGV